jgi:tetratricopeptide (TPR) repeat protein
MGQVPGGDINRAKLALQNNRPDEAERICRKRLERKPEDTQARMLLAQALLQLQRPDDAQVEARRATREQPTNSDAFLLLSAALAQKQNRRALQEAEETARRAVQLAPRQARTHVQLAEVLAARQDLKGARAEAEEAARIEPRLAAAHLIRGMVMLSERDAAGAVPALESALRYEGGLFPAHFALANAYVEVRRYDDALASLERAQALNPLLPPAQVEGLRGRIYLKQRRFGPAYREFQRAQRSSGRLPWLAPATAALSMTQVFGRYAPVVVIAIILLAILFGIGFIPVVGPWIAVLALLAVLGVSFFGALRQYEGAILPSGPGRMAALGATVVAGIAVFVVVLYLGTWAIAHLSKPNPLTFFIAGVLGLGAAAGAAYMWPRVRGRIRRGPPVARAA